MIGPIGLNRIPELLQSLFIRITVLYDQTCDPVRMLQGEPPPYGSTIVHDVHGEASDIQLIEKTVNQFCNVVEGVSEFGAVRHIALAISRIIGSNDMVQVRQGRYEIAEHVR